MTIGTIMYVGRKDLHPGNAGKPMKDIEVADLKKVPNALVKKVDEVIFVNNDDGNTSKCLKSRFRKI